MTTSYEVPDGPKMLRKTLCLAQTAIGALSGETGRHHIDRLQRLINACDVHRPLGPDGKHGDRHTRTCGCEDDPASARMHAGLGLPCDRCHGPCQIDGPTAPKLPGGTS